MKQRIVYLDIIRIIACLMVIIMHAPMPSENISAYGPLLVLLSYVTAPCVPLFFMVSGALLLPCKDDIVAGGYLKKRIGKILGPTVCFSVFYIVLNISEIRGDANGLFTVNTF